MFKFRKSNYLKEDLSSQIIYIYIYLKKKTLFWQIEEQNKRKKFLILKYYIIKANTAEKEVEKYLTKSFQFCVPIKVKVSQSCPILCDPMTIAH